MLCEDERSLLSISFSLAACCATCSFKVGMIFEFCMRVLLTW